MIDLELKKKIINTISRYEVKCDKMQGQIDALKNAINQLIIPPMGVYFEMDDHLAEFRKQIDDEIDPVVLEKKVHFLAALLTKIQKKKSEHTHMISGLIKQSTDSISRLANRAQDKRAVGKLQQMLDKEVEHHAILVNFNEVLTQCVSSVTKDLEELQNNKSDDSRKNGELNISVKINDSLNQLINHLSIPKDLDKKKEQIKINLDNQLKNDELIKTIDELTELVVDAFNVEQNRFKGFLKQVSNQLQDFDVYLKKSTSNNKEALEDSLSLENGIQENIDQIKSHLDNSTTIEELAVKVSKNLDGIGSRIQEYRSNEKKRGEVLEKQVQSLQLKLTESEQSAEEIKNLLSFQRYRINHDSLTGLPNRESYDEHLLDAFQRWKLTETEFSMAVCDIDRFKRINDTFGHLAGDKVLKKVAELLKSSLRSSDFIARIGGEEFVIIFEQTSSKTAAVVLEKLRKLVEECQFFYRENKVDVTVSFGLTTVKKEDDIESLFIRADNAMYNAKNGGRNRVEIL